MKHVPSILFNYEIIGTTGIRICHGLGQTVADCLTKFLLAIILYIQCTYVNTCILIHSKNSNNISSYSYMHAYIPLLLPWLIPD